MKQSPRYGLLPHPIAGQPGIFRLIPSLARKTHHSTVSWKLVGWHPAMNTRACFCSNIKKTRHILDWTRTSISELSVRHSTIKLHLQSRDSLFAVSIFQIDFILQSSLLWEEKHSSKTSNTWIFLSSCHNFFYFSFMF